MIHKQILSIRQGYGQRQRSKTCTEQQNDAKTDLAKVATFFHDHTPQSSGTLESWAFRRNSSSKCSCRVGGFNSLEKDIYIYNILVGSHGLGMEDEPTGRRCSDQTGRLSDSGSARGVSLDHGGAPGICFEHRKNDRFLNGGERCGLDGVGGVQRFQVSGVSGWY